VLLSGQQEGHPVYKKFCHSNSQKFILGIVLTQSNFGRSGRSNKNHARVCVPRQFFFCFFLGDKCVPDLHVRSSAVDRQGSETTGCVGKCQEQRTTFASPSVADVELCHNIHNCQYIQYIT